MLMKSVFYVCLTTLLGGCSYIHHVPPGQSAALSLAKRPELVSTPAPPAAVAPAPGPAAPVEALPDTEKIADSFTLGNLCMEQGRYAEAVAAYENTLKLNPQFAEAWSKLAIAYQNLGEDKKALDAFKKSKTVSMQ
jgi:tetratricopeptide (TPR) repeat protein